MSEYIASPTSRKKIRYLTSSLREAFDVKEKMFFPVLLFLEYGLSQIDENFNYEIIPSEQMDGNYAETHPEYRNIFISENVYDRAFEGSGRDRFTIAHEIGHFLMHKPGRIALARKEQLDKDLPAYKKPEWQANTFAGELLAPPHLIEGLTESEISTKCGVSIQAAEIQLKQI